MLKKLKKGAVVAIMTVLVFGGLGVPKIVWGAPDDLGQCFCLPENPDGTPNPNAAAGQALCIDHYIDNGDCPTGCEQVITTGGASSGNITNPDDNAIIEELTLACEDKIADWKNQKSMSNVPPSSNPNCPAGFTCLESPLNNKQADVPYIIGMVIRGFMGIAGALVLLMVVWGAQQWLTAAGKAEKIQQGTHTIIWAFVGALVLFLAYILLNQVLKVLSEGF